MSEKNPQNWNEMQMDDHEEGQPLPSFTHMDFRNDTFEDTNLAGLEYRFSDFRKADLFMAVMTGAEQWEGCNFHRARISPAFLAVLKKVPGVTLPDGTRNPPAAAPAAAKVPVTEVPPSEAKAGA